MSNTMPFRRRSLADAAAEADADADADAEAEAEAGGGMAMAAKAIMRAFFMEARALPLSLYICVWRATEALKLFRGDGGHRSAGATPQIDRDRHTHTHTHT